MTAASRLISPSASSNIRPINLRKDIGAIADLVELCFADRLDSDGHRYLSQMRAAARNPGIIGMAGSMVPSMRGYVWEESGELIGNLNLIPVMAAGERAYLIANVAVHPDHRRKGIARAMTEEAQLYIRRRNIKASWLQVDADNSAAQDLYKSIGFTEQTRRTTWHSTAEAPLPKSSAEIEISPRRSADWPQQKEWLDILHPPRFYWHLAIKPKILRPGLPGLITRITSEKKIRQWSAYKEGALIGTASWQSSTRQADWLWLATSREYEAEAIGALLPYARLKLPSRHTLAVNYPAGRAEQELKDAGFYPHQTLIWMYLRFKAG